MEDLTHTPNSTNKSNTTNKGSSPVTWSIRGVERDTRLVIEKAAERAGKTIGQYVNEDIRGLVQSQLVQSQTPAAPIDIQNQIDQLTRMVETLTNRMPEPGKKSFWKRLFE
ncbi:hypothetical protein [Spirosoma oryzae]|uniref:hypothetical protein n=1 Tax=Spirosoma oryzae TaxID=1469603 RepID=UPI000D05E146|nr:hypothetical protein [Spirosoma oryzae]